MFHGVHFTGGGGGGPSRAHVNGPLLKKGLPCIEFVNRRPQLCMIH